MWDRVLACALLLHNSNKKQMKNNSADLTLRHNVVLLNSKPLTSVCVPKSRVTDASCYAGAVLDVEHQSKAF